MLPDRVLVHWVNHLHTSAVCMCHTQCTLWHTGTRKLLHWLVHSSSKFSLMAFIRTHIIDSRMSTREGEYQHYHILPVFQTSLQDILVSTKLIFCKSLAIKINIISSLIHWPRILNLSLGFVDNETNKQTNKQTRHILPAKKEMIPLPLLVPYSGSRVFVHHSARCTYSCSCTHTW